MKTGKKLNKEELLQLFHNDHQDSFHKYLRGARHTVDKQSFLRLWLNPQKDDYILECGSSGGKTCVDLARTGHCFCLGIDFDPIAVKIANEMRNKYFADLENMCQFQQGDLETMIFDKRITKILMADFTEHIPDEVFANILGNIKKQLPGIPVYIYTPQRLHIFERMKHNNFILKNQSGHINVKSSHSLINFLKDNGWKIKEIRWRPSHIPLFRVFEKFAGHIPIVGSLFQRKIAIIAQ